MAKKLPFLKTGGQRIVDEAGKPVTLKGVNLGGWLMMEGYMFGGRNTAEHDFRNSFEKELGGADLEDFTRSFRDSFIQESDIKTIKSWGANCIRIPFNYRLIEFENRPYSLNEEGLSYLDKAIGWCEKHGIYCILDLHAAPGAQNDAWHSDSYGKQELFPSEVNKDRYLRLWFFLADRYREESAVAGYDVLNEPVVGILEENQVRDLYERVTREIRDTDKKHIIFLEGNLWAQRLEFLGNPKDDNTAYSIHMYAPLDFTHNFEVELRYPGKAYGIMWNKDRFDTLAKAYDDLARKARVPLYLGEFGVNARGGNYGEDYWVRDVLSACKKYNFSWTYWTYKTIANYAYPDGIYRYIPNPAWVNRQGPIAGLEAFASVWPKEKGSMIYSWRTENFKRNDKIFSALKEYL
ncbi:MAG: glycoside hydrolase family 5 protein [Candidatus Omnitrophota bacterium]|nr:glycoside hydrolase family 5 protein [Candidatus Omnitrophota bacterium]